MVTNRGDGPETVRRRAPRWQDSPAGRREEPDGALAENTFNTGP